MASANVQYAPVPQETEDSFENEPKLPSRRRRWELIVFVAVVVIATLALLAASQTSTAEPSCSQPVLRREWRTLSTAEQSEYLRAVRCLHDLPSGLGLSGKLSDDFPWIHFNIGNFAHGKAAFLSWHRWFIHLYEKTLQESCGYVGNLVYWDWSLDWEELPASPVWSPTLGFGGDGDPDLPRTDIPGDGSCIENGPFSDYEVHYTGWSTSPHCLSRGFGRFPASHNFSGDAISPAALQDVLNHDDFHEFIMALESGPHDAIPNGVGGDFLILTAPNDPIFFLHHTQLDRIWWIWQQKDKERRLRAYHGSVKHPASPEDVLPYEPLSANITVADILDTETAMLCYRY
ncbi:hypothetical protein BX600DRAFT_510745 [Xylariales sp. PMI_506]|nr:hypothetical protein BX600DRAFT_510745 [Xylariales sp. PMI_506]